MIRGTANTRDTRILEIGSPLPTTKGEGKIKNITNNLIMV